jgi:lipoprotein-releasing system permease protein
MSFYELTLGWRYTRAKRRNRFVSFIALISMLGIALGVAALIVVLSVMNGFQNELRSRILAASSHVQLRGADGPLTDWPTLAAQAQRSKEVSAVAPYVEGDALFSTDRANRPGLVRGIDPLPETAVADIAQHMRFGKLENLKAGEFGVILGRDLAHLLGARVGSKVVLTIPQGTATPVGTVPRSKAFRVVGIFEIGFQEADSRVALVHIADAQRLYQLDDTVTGMRVRLHDLFTSQRIAAEWSKTLPAGVVIADWTKQNANWFRAIAIEKRAMWVILTLIVAVAAFNVVSTLVMTVTEKQADIAILRTLGATQKSILSIFVLQGAIIGLVGTLIGAVLGIIVAQHIDVIVPFIERTLGFAFIDPTVYQITELPSDMHWDDVWQILAITLVLSLIAAIYPARNASKTHPAEALRYE